MVENSIVEPFMRSMPYGSSVPKKTKKFNLKQYKKKNKKIEHPVCGEKGCSI